MVSYVTRQRIQQRLADETGRLDKQAPLTVGLVYPSPYHVAMSSLGFQRIYRILQELPGVACERAFLADADVAEERERPVTYESRRPLDEFPVLAFSVAYELELAGLLEVLTASGIPLTRDERDERHPLIVAGGPLTFSNPLPLAPFVDVVIMGEAEEVVPFLMNAVQSSSKRASLLDTLAQHPNVFVPAHHGSRLAKIAACDDALLPAESTIITPHTELSNMFLIEAERGCSRACTYCVMRRSTNGGMRLVPKELLLERIPTSAPRVGLVGAAVSDHPKIVEIVRALAERGQDVGLSSLRPDRLKEEFVEALKLAGHRVLTTALDGPSERMRGVIERRGREPHYVAAAERARKYGMDRLKLYLMIGLPGETDEDIDECVRFVGELSKIVPIALGIAPFCAKRNTPLDRMPFAGVKLVEGRLERLRRGLRGRADVRGTSARWAFVEYVLAQGGEAEGLALARAVARGGRYADYLREFKAIGHEANGAGYAETKAPRAPEIAKMRRSLDIVT